MHDSYSCTFVIINFIENSVLLNNISNFGGKLLNKTTSFVLALYIMKMFTFAYADVNKFLSDKATK
jgi:hypothetical protein